MWVESPEIVPIDSDWWYRPAGRFLLLTGPNAPMGGNPMVSGDEGRVFCSNIYDIDADNGIYGFTSSIAFSIDQTNPDTNVTGGVYDIHELMAAVSPDASVANLTNYWIAPLTATARGVEGIAIIPLDLKKAARPVAATPAATPVVAVCPAVALPVLRQLPRLHPWRV